MTDAEKLGVRLREARKNIGFSLVDVQELTGYSRQQIYRYEYGKNIPRL